MNFDLERYSVDELNRLRVLAEEYVGSSEMTSCKWLYRDKSREYFEMSKNNYKSWINTIEKDCGGDARSPINGCLKGLFFSASVQPGSNKSSPREKSAFGNTRLIIKIEELANGNNLYFTDFYCTGNVQTKRDKYHYITLVITKQDSISDRFCSQFLLKLDWFSNKFLRERYSQYSVTMKEDLLVEVFYTENIKMTPLINRGLASMTEVETFSQGHSTMGGKAKNSICDICNLKNIFSSANSRRATRNDANRLIKEYEDSIREIMNSKNCNDKNQYMHRSCDNLNIPRQNQIQPSPSCININVYPAGFTGGLINLENYPVNQTHMTVVETSPRTKNTDSRADSKLAKEAAIDKSPPPYQKSKKKKVPTATLR